MSFYGSGLGDRLIDETLFPIEIKNFLLDEENILTQLKYNFESLIEVGCMHGRYLPWAIKYVQNYIGIDVIPSYIEAGRKRYKEYINKLSNCEFILGNAENIDSLLNWKLIHINPKKSVILFPFNSFGNMQNYLSVIKSLKRSGVPFIISTYTTSPFSTLCRQQYYNACLYLDLEKIEDEKGVAFISKDGLNTIAYHKNYLLNIFKTEKITVNTINFAQIGILYTSYSMNKL